MTHKPWGQAALLCGLVLVVAGCAPTPTVTPLSAVPRASEACGLLCEMAAFFEAGHAPAPQSIVAAPPTRDRKALEPATRRVTRPQPMKRPRSSPKLKTKHSRLRHGSREVTGVPNPDLGQVTSVPRSPSTSPDPAKAAFPPLPNFAVLPGSVPIEGDTTRFVPQTATTP